MLVKLFIRKESEKLKMDFHITMYSGCNVLLDKSQGIVYDITRDYSSS